MPDTPPKSFHIKLSIDQRERIRQEAFRQDVPMAEVVRRLLEQLPEPEREEVAP